MCESRLQENKHAACDLPFEIVQTSAMLLGSRRVTRGVLELSEELTSLVAGVTFGQEGIQGVQIARFDNA
jgi:hypothetical protein